MKYTKSTSMDGERAPDEVVDEQFVEKYSTLKTLEFFRSLGGTETVVRHGDGTIACTSVSPDGDHTRITVFTPLKEES